MMKSFANFAFFYILVISFSICITAEDKISDKSNSDNNKNADGNAAAEFEIKIYKRLIPADVLRDFPGMCFASTRCATVEPGKTWELTPFCGRSTCVQNEEDASRLLELVEDCGPLPLANEKCKLDTDKTNKTAAFPYCCPIFTCEPGVQLEYPDISSKSAAAAPTSKE